MNGAIKYIGKTYSENKYGEFKVLNYRGSHCVDVLFTNTGSKKTTTTTQIKLLNVKDNLFPLVASVGFIGNGPHASGSNYMPSAEYQIWRAMIYRCYKESCAEYKWYGRNGIKVCDEWHNFQNFAEWYKENIPDRNTRWHLDKDILGGGKKIYSPETCKFVTAMENSEKALAKAYRLKSPDGVYVDIYNMKKFCSDKELIPSKMAMVFYGKRLSHKGWTK